MFRAGRRAEAEPVQEMFGLLREGAHVAGAHVEEMARIGRAIGEAASEFARPLDQEHPGRGALAQELQGDEEPAEAGADDSDIRGDIGPGGLRRRTVT